MTYLLLSTEGEGVSFSDVTVQEVTTVGRFNAALQRAAVRVGTTSDSYVLGNFSSSSEVWVHFDIYRNASGVGADLVLLELLSASGARARLIRPSQSSPQLIAGQTWSGDTWVTRWTVTLPIGSLSTVDVHYVGGSTGRFAIYVSSTLTAAWDGSIGTPAEVDQIYIRNVSQSGTAANNLHISQLAISTTPTVGLVFYQRIPNGAGASNDWTGAFGDVNEVVTDDTTFISSDTADQVELFTLSSLSIPQGRVRGVAISMRAINNAGGPENIQGAVRISGVNYFTANLTTLNPGWGNVVAFWENDPSTGLPWARAQAENAALEAGVRSRT